MAARKDMGAARPDEQAIEAANELACRAAATANGLSQDKADSCEDAERNCPNCPFRRAAATSAQEAQIAMLREALEHIAGFTLSQFMGPNDMALACVETARAALSKTTGSTS